MFVGNCHLTLLVTALAGGCTMAGGKGLRRFGASITGVGIGIMLAVLMVGLPVGTLACGFCC